MTAQQDKKISPRRFEIVVAGAAVLMLLVVQWALSAAIQGTNYISLDGKMAQATILAAIKYSGVFHVNNISPIEGVGSQILTMNIWLNPAYWPFAWLDRELATDVSALVALGVFMIACYLMARCFDVPVVPSAIAAQCCILLFAPTLLLLVMPTVFALTPGNAVVYAPHMIALGLLARIEPGSWRSFGVLTGGIFLLLLYSLFADPLWSVVNGFAWALPFAVVVVASFRLKTILLRAGALACCVILLAASGAAEYLYTLSQYTSRVHYPALIDRPRSLGLATAVAYSIDMPQPSYIKIFYIVCVIGCLLGLVTLRGRPRVLAAAATVSFVVWLAYTTVYLLLLNAVWVPPIPTYVEHSLFALYIAGACAGYFGALQWTAAAAQRVAVPVGRVMAQAPRPAALQPLVQSLGAMPRPRLRQAAPLVVALMLVAIVPAKVGHYVRTQSGPLAQVYYQPWPSEPELLGFLQQHVSSQVGQPLGGSLVFPTFNEGTAYTMANAWAHGMHSVDEYSQLVTPQAVYFLYAFLKQNEVLGSLNGFVPFPGPSWSNFEKAMQLFGVRYYLTGYGRMAPLDQAGYPVVELPRRPHGNEPGLWHIYEFPRANTGNYSPTRIVTAQSAAETINLMAAPEFDFAKQAVLASPLEGPLVEARDMRLSRIRGGFHVSGQSAGTSLVILPIQFSHCLRARDPGVRFVRADLMMAGMIFSGRLDTDIRFDYGVFSPRCRRADLTEARQLDMRIDLRMAHLTGDRVFPDRKAALAKLRDIGLALGILHEAKSTPPPPPEEPPPEEPVPSGPVVAQETPLAEVAKSSTERVAFIGIQGLNADVVDVDPVATGQPVRRLVAVPTNGRHFLAARYTANEKGARYRVAAWIKAPPGVKVEMELRDSLDRKHNPDNYGIATFDPGRKTVVTSSPGLSRGIEPGLEGWQKIWVDLATTDGQIVLGLGLIKGDKRMFQGDGRLGVTFGGLEIARRE